VSWITVGFANPEHTSVGFVNRRRHSYRSAALVKYCSNGCAAAHRALRVLRSTWTILATRAAAFRDSRSAELSLGVLSVESNRAAKSLTDENEMEKIVAKQSARARVVSAVTAKWPTQRGAPHIFELPLFWFFGNSA